MIQNNETISGVGPDVTKRQCTQCVFVLLWAFDIVQQRWIHTSNKNGQIYCRIDGIIPNA